MDFLVHLIGAVHAECPCGKGHLAYVGRRIFLQGNACGYGRLLAFPRELAEAQKKPF